MRTFMIVAAGLLGTATVATANRADMQRDGLRIEDVRARGVLAVVTLPTDEALGPDTDTASMPRLRIAKKARRQVEVENEKSQKLLQELQGVQNTRPGTSSPRGPSQGQPGGMRRK